MKFDLDNTYWDNNGRFTNQSRVLKSMISIFGGCDKRLLEFFRIVSNTYYDIYNNGACNPERFQPLEAALRLYANDLRALDSSYPAQFNELIEWISRAANNNDFDYILQYLDGLTEDEFKVLQQMERLVDLATALAWKEHTGEDLTA
jgi:hypothetical protein